MFKEKHPQQHPSITSRPWPGQDRSLIPIITKVIGGKMKSWKRRRVYTETQVEPAAIRVESNQKSQVAGGTGGASWILSRSPSADVNTLRPWFDFTLMGLLRATSSVSSSMGGKYDEDVSSRGGTADRFTNSGRNQRPNQSDLTPVYSVFVSGRSRAASHNYYDETS